MSSARLDVPVTFAKGHYVASVPDLPVPITALSLAQLHQADRGHADARQRGGPAGARPHGALRERNQRRRGGGSRAGDYARAR